MIYNIYDNVWCIWWAGNLVSPQPPSAQTLQSTFVDRSAPDHSNTNFVLSVEVIISIISRVIKLAFSLFQDRGECSQWNVWTRKYTSPTFMFTSSWVSAFSLYPKINTSVFEFFFIFSLFFLLSLFFLSECPFLFILRLKQVFPFSLPLSSLSINTNDIEYLSTSTFLLILTSTKYHWI